MIFSTEDTEGADKMKKMAKKLIKDRKVKGQQ